MKNMIIILAGLLLVACGSRTHTEESTDSLDDLSLLQPLSREYLDSALMKDAEGGIIMVMDVASGKILIDYSSKKLMDYAIEPGHLLSTMVLSTILDDPDMNLDTAMRVKVGCQYFPGPYCEKDFGADFDDLDSLPLHRAIALNSSVAMCELGEMYYSSCRDSLKARLTRMVDFSNDSWHIRDMGRLLVDPEREKHLEMYRSRMFYNMCCGRGVTVNNPRDILNFYNSLAKKQCKTAETLRGLLMETAEADIAREASAYRIAGLSANVSDVSSPTRLTTSIVGFFPADNPRYTCMVIKYGSTSRGQEAATLFIKVADALMTQLHYSNSTQQK